MDSSLYNSGFQIGRGVEGNWEEEGGSFAIFEDMLDCHDLKGGEWVTGQEYC